MEAIEITAKNLKIAEIYTKAVANSADGVLLSGSNAWGANHAVTLASDIDLLITAEVEQLEQVIETLVSQDLLVAGEKERFKIVRTFYNDKKAEQFSTVEIHSNTKVSLDFIPWEKVEDICELRPLKTQQIGGISVRTIKEFRVNPPKSTGYSVDDLTGQRKLTYHAKFEEVNMGYLADILVDAQTDFAYFMGVMSFFFAVSPSVLLDKEGRLEREIKALQSNIAQIMGGEVPTYITRQERISPEILAKIKRSLS